MTNSEDTHQSVEAVMDAPPQEMPILIENWKAGRRDVRQTGIFWMVLGILSLILFRSFLPAYSAFTIGLLFFFLIHRSTFLLSGLIAMTCSLYTLGGLFGETHWYDGLILVMFVALFIWEVRRYIIHAEDFPPPKETSRNPRGASHSSAGYHSIVFWALSQIGFSGAIFYKYWLYYYSPEKLLANQTPRVFWLSFLLTNIGMLLGLLAGLYGLIQWRGRRILVILGILLNASTLVYTLSMIARK